MFVCLVLCATTVGTITTIMPRKPTVDVQISNYPKPLDLNGEFRYHVTINGQTIGMIDEDAEMILNLFGIEPYTGKQFNEMGLGDVIWPRKQINTKGFATQLTGRTR